MPLAPHERPKGTGQRAPDKKKVQAASAAPAGSPRQKSNSTDTGPSLPRKIVNLGVAQTAHTAQGRPTLPQSIIVQRHNICLYCPSNAYNPTLKRCTDPRCGCNVNLDPDANNNKLAMPSQACPQKHWKSYTRKELVALNASAHLLPIIGNQ